MSEHKPLTCLPVLPLRGLVVFPGVVTHFDVGRLKSAKSVEEAMRADQRIFLTAQKDLSVDDPKKNDLYAVGTVAIVKQILRMPGDNMRILVEGKFRAELVDCIQSEPYLFARVEEIEEPAYNASLPRVQALLRQAHGAYEQFVELAAKNLQDGLFAGSLVGRPRLRCRFHRAEQFDCLSGQAEDSRTAPPCQAAGADREASCKGAGDFTAGKRNLRRRSSRTSTRGSATTICASRCTSFARSWAKRTTRQIPRAIRKKSAP